MDENSTKISIDFGTNNHSYKTIRQELFLSGDDLQAKVDEIKKARDEKDYEKIGIRGMVHGTRFEKQLENPIYKVVPENGDVPEHIIAYNAEDRLPFMHNRTVRITTSGRLFIESPVKLKEGVEKVTAYLGYIRDAVKRANGELNK